MSESIDNKKRTLIKWIISIVIALIPLVIGTNETYTPQIQHFLIFTLLGICLLAFELLNGFAVSFLMIAGWVLTGATDFAGAMASFTTTNFIMIVTAMVFVNVLQKTGVLTRLGYWSILKAGGSFKGMIWGLFFTIILIQFVGFVLMMVLCYALAYAMYKAFELKPSDKESVVIVWVTSLAAITSAVYLYCPITVTLVNASAGTVIEGFNLVWYKLIFYNAPMFLVSIFLVWLVLKWYEKSTKKIDVSNVKGKEYFRRKYSELGKITLEEKKCAVLLILLALFLFTQEFHGLDSAYGFLFAAVLSFAPGINLADNNCIKNVGWDNIFVLVAFLTIGDLATSLGLTSIISQAVIPVIAQMGNYWSPLGTAALAGLVNFVLSPFAMTAALPGPIAAYCLGAGFNPLVHIVSLYFAKEIIFLPYEYPAYLILFAFGMVKIGTMIKICTIKSLLILIAFVVIMMPYWWLIGLY